jgi:hypothetical protein
MFSLGLGHSKMAVRPVLPRGFWFDRNGVGAQRHNEQSDQNANLWDWSLASRFLYRFRVLHGSLSELRNCFHRIRSLKRQGDIRPFEIGPVYHKGPVPAHLVRNVRSPGRSLGIQKLLAEFPWMTTEDCRIFLSGWDTAEEWRERLDTVDSTPCNQS